MLRTRSERNMSLQYNLSQLLKSDVGERREYDFERVEPLLLDDTVARNIRGSVKFTLTNFGIVASVRAHATLELTCARCLESFEAPVDISFEEEYQPTIDIATGLASTMPRSDTAFAISANHTIDLREALRQHLLLAVDLVPLCGEGCKGLCPTCGHNLNTGPCSCPVEEETSPFAVLQGLLSDPEVER
jgi:uncharacterized protein